jgi:hypothetical protein
VHILLQTPRLVLRQFTEGDVDNLFELNSDLEVMRYLTGGRGTPRDEIRDEIIPLHLEAYRRLPYERTDPIEGGEHGEVEYALTRPDWEADSNVKANSSIKA